MEGPPVFDRGPFPFSARKTMCHSTEMVWLYTQSC